MCYRQEQRFRSSEDAWLSLNICLFPSLLQPPEQEDIGLSMAQDRRLSGGACSIPRLQEGLGAALRLELTRDLECPEVYLQVDPSDHIFLIGLTMRGHGVEKSPRGRRLCIHACSHAFQLSFSERVGCMSASKEVHSP